MARGISLPLRLTSIRRAPAWHKRDGEWGSSERATIELSGHGSKVTLYVDAEAADAAGMWPPGRAYQVTIEPAPQAPLAGADPRAHGDDAVDPPVKPGDGNEGRRPRAPTGGGGPGERGGDDNEGCDPRQLSLLPPGRAVG